MQILNLVRHGNIDGFHFERMRELLCEHLQFFGGSAAAGGNHLAAALQILFNKRESQPARRADDQHGFGM